MNWAGHFLAIPLAMACLSSSFILVHGHSSYVPETKEVCETMEPHHKREPQTTESPFKVIVYTGKVQPGKTVSSKERFRLFTVYVAASSQFSFSLRIIFNEDCVDFQLAW